MRGWRAGAATAAAGGDHDPDPGIHTFLPSTTSHADTDPDIHTFLPPTTSHADTDPGIHTFLPPTTSHADTDPDISKIWLTCPRNIIIYRYHLTIANPA